VFICLSALPHEKLRSPNLTYKCSVPPWVLETYIHFGGIKLKELGVGCPKVNIDDKIGGWIHELGGRTLPTPGNSHTGQKIKGQGHEAQKHCRRSWSSCECSLFLVYYYGQWWREASLTVGHYSCSYVMPFMPNGPFCRGCRCYTHIPGTDRPQSTDCIAINSRCVQLFNADCLSVCVCVCWRASSCGAFTYLRVVNRTTMLPRMVDSDAGGGGGHVRPLP